MGSFLFLQKRDRPTEQERERNRAKLQVGRYVKKKKKKKNKKNFDKQSSRQAGKWTDNQAFGQAERQTMCHPCKVLQHCEFFSGFS